MKDRATCRMIGPVLAAVAACMVCGCSTMRLADVSAHNLDWSLRAAKPKCIHSLNMAMLGRPGIEDNCLEAGDVLEINISDFLEEHQNYTLLTRVGPDGTVSLPMVGSVLVQDLTVTESENVICANYVSKGYLHNPRMVVSLKESRPNRAYVLGAVKSPGVYELSRSESDLLAAIVAAGGLTENAGTVIEIRSRNRTETTAPQVASRDGLLILQAVGDEPDGDLAWTRACQAASFEGPRDGGPTPRARQDSCNGIVRYDLSESKDQQAIAQGVLLHNGDIVSIEDRKAAPIYVLGSVRSPGPYPLPSDRELRVLEAIGSAGGVNMNTTPDKALVIRHHPDGQRVTVVKIDLDMAKKDLDENIILAAGDTVSVEETPASFLRGIVRNMFRIGVGVGAQYNMAGPAGAAAF